MRRPVPQFLKKRLPLASTRQVRRLIEDMSLSTVCQSAHCPNLAECFASGSAAFMILGEACTRDCRFCAVRSAEPSPPDADEPRRVAEAVARMELEHVVVTSVTRDDLPDGGASHFADTIAEIRSRIGSVIEVLVPDFAGRTGAIDTVLAAGPDVFNHNVETVPRLYRRVRPQADFARSLAVLERAAASARTTVKSGLMVGLGEVENEVLAIIDRLVATGVDIITIGQYLAPSDAHLTVERYVEPEEYSRYEAHGIAAGARAVAAGPFVRSSYKAGEVYGALPHAAPSASVVATQGEA